MSDPILKILIIGPSNVGKSALLRRYCDDDFDADDAAATIGIDFRVKRLSVHGRTYRINLFDTAGQERFRTLSTSYYRGAHGIVFVYDLTNRTTFGHMDTYFAEAEANTGPSSAAPGPPCQMCLVGAKLDRAATSRAVMADEGMALARKHYDGDGEPLFFEASARTGDSVREPFVALVDRIVSAGALTLHGAPGTAAGAVSLQSPSGEGGKGGSSASCAC